MFASSAISSKATHPIFGTINSNRIAFSSILLGYQCCFLIIGWVTFCIPNKLKSIIVWLTHCIKLLKQLKQQIAFGSSTIEWILELQFLTILRLYSCYIFNVCQWSNPGVTLANRFTVLVSSRSPTITTHIKRYRWAPKPRDHWTPVQCTKNNKTFAIYLIWLIVLTEHCPIVTLIIDNSKICPLAEHMCHMFVTGNGPLSSIVLSP